MASLHSAAKSVHKANALSAKCRHGPFRYAISRNRRAGYKCSTCPSFWVLALREHDGKLYLVITLQKDAEVLVSYGITDFDIASFPQLYDQYGPFQP